MSRGLPVDDGASGSACRRRLPEPGQDRRMARRERASPRRGRHRRSAAGSSRVLKQGGRQGGGLAGVLEQLGSNLRGATPGGILSGGLGELIDRFKQSGQAETAEFLGRARPEPAGSAGRAGARDRSRHAGYAVAADRAVAAGAARPPVARASRRGRQVHARRTVAAGLTAPSPTGGLFRHRFVEGAPGGQIGERAARDQRLAVGAPARIGRERREQAEIDVHRLETCGFRRRR